MSVENDVSQQTSLGQQDSALDVLREYGVESPTPNNSSTPSVEEEMASFADKTLEHDAAKQNHKRDQKWKDHFSWAFIGAFWFLWFLFLVMCFSLIMHWILPVKCHWLSVEQLDKIKVLIIAALASKAISSKIEKTQ